MSNNEIVYRSAEVRAEDLADSGEIRLLCSTSDAVDMGGYREVLVHNEGAVEMSSCRSVLLNHDADQIVGAVKSLEIANGQLRAVVVIDEAARSKSGVPVRNLVKSGALRGVSIGYVRDLEASQYDERSNTVTVPKWALRELTLTPTPADVKAQVVRSLPTHFAPAPINSDSRSNAAPAAEMKGSPMADDKKPQDLIPEPAKTNDEGVRAAEIAALRTRAADVKKITELAESHGMRASEFIDQPYEKALESMLAKKAGAEKSDVRASGVKLDRIEVGADQADKSNAEAADAVLSGRSILDVARRHANAAGLQSNDMNRQDLAAYVLGRAVPGMSKRTANVTSSMFNTVVLANIMDKEVLNGFNNYAKTVTYPIWTRRRSVMDFKSFSAGALDSGNLVETAENLAFPELTKAEGSYSATLGLWGATISLTYQAIVNDDMGEFMNMLNRAGGIAQRTIDKKVYAVVNAATWTGNTDSVTSLATAGDLDTSRKSFEKKVGPAGEVIGNTPKYLLVPSCLRTTALQLTTQVQGSTALVTQGDLIPVITPHLTEAGTASQSGYYLAGDPSLCDTVVVAFLSGAETPQVMEYDSGAVAKRSWKIMQAFVPVLASTTVSGTIYIPGMQQGL